jgi:hypothetical protein
MTKYLIIAAIMLLPLSIYAANPVDELLTKYRLQSADSFNAEAGKKLWNQEFTRSSSVP